MGVETVEDRARSAAIYAAYLQPGATYASVGVAFDISPSRASKIVAREFRRKTNIRSSRIGRALWLAKTGQVAA